MVDILKDTVVQSLEVREMSFRDMNTTGRWGTLSRRVVHSFSKRMLVLAVASALIPISFAVYYMHDKNHEIASRSTTKFVTNFTATLASDIGLALGDGDYDRLQLAATQFKSDSNFVFLELTDESGAILFEHNPNGVVLLKRSTMDSLIVSERYVEQELNIWYRDAMLGHLVVRYSLESENASLDALLLQTVLFSALILLATSALFWWSLQRNSQLILRIREKVTQVTSGDLGVSLSTPLKNEIGDLARAFNRMVEQMRSLQDASEKEMERAEEEARRAELSAEHAQQSARIADEANKAKSEFLANMSHEIRTPLNGVIGFSDILRKTSLDETQMKYVTTVHNSANNLLSIINNILDFSKIEANKLELSEDRVDLYELCMQVIDIVSYQIQVKKLEILLNIAADTPRYIWADELRLKQILINLLGNASKFTEVGEIELAVSVDDIHDLSRKTFHFSVRDTGIGIEEQNQKKIFDAFSQEDSSTTKKYGGTGLGLAISNRLIQLMGSTLQLKSKVNEGSVFFFAIDFECFEEEAPVSDSLRHFKRILVIDDNASNLSLVQNSLRLHNIDSSIATSAMDGIALLLGDNVYDALIIDYQMPEMDGLEAIRRIRHKLKLSNDELPILLLHSSANHEHVSEECIKLDVQHSLSKPITKAQLLLALERLHEPKQTRLVLHPDVELQPQSSLGSTSARILIAEDQPVNMVLLSTIIRNLLPKAVIIESVNGVDAVQAYAMQHIDFVFMDIQMPQMNGYEAARAIRAEEKRRSMSATTIVALTASAVSGERERCLDAGMNDYITKPITMDVVANVLSKWLELQSSLSATPSQTLEATSPQNAVVTEGIVQHFDKADFIQRLGENAASMLSQSIPAILKFLDEDYARLVELSTQQNIEGMVAVAHKLKGAALSMSLPVLASICRTLEQQENYCEPVMNELLRALEGEIHAVKICLNTVHDKSPHTLTV